MTITTLEKVDKRRLALKTILSLLSQTKETAFNLFKQKFSLAFPDHAQTTVNF